MIRVFDHKNRNTVLIYFGKEDLKLLPSKEIVFYEDNGELMFREAMIMDNKRSVIRDDRYCSYASQTAKSYIGQWNLFKQDDSDWFVLTKH
jgi:hypothetical protein